MIETQTTFTDSGFDCDHCGGRILRRIDTETGRPDIQCYQCEACSCQWTLDNQPLRIGIFNKCQKAQKVRATSEDSALENYSIWILMGILGLGLLFVLRFAGPFVLRFVLPIVVITAVVYLGIRLVRNYNG